MKHAGRNKMGTRIAPGFWIDADGNGHISTVELLEMAGLPNTPENCRFVAQMLVEQGHVPPDMLYRERNTDTHAIALDGKSIMCFKCGKRSYNPADVHNKYCGNCHEFHASHDARQAAE